MIARDIIISIFGMNTISQKRLGAMMGVPQNYISKMLKKTTLTVSNFVKVCNALGYEITVQPIKQTSGARPKEQYVVTVPTEEDKARELKDWRHERDRLNPAKAQDKSGKTENA